MRYISKTETAKEAQNRRHNYHETIERIGSFAKHALSAWNLDNQGTERTENNPDAPPILKWTTQASKKIDIQVAILHNKKLDTTTRIIWCL